MKDSPHLDAARWAALRAGTLASDEHDALVEHLEHACEVCEDFLRAVPTADEMDAIVDETLLGLAEHRTRHPAPVARSWSRMVAYSGVLLAAAGVALVVARPAVDFPVPTSREKGPASRSLSVELEVVARAGDARAFSMVAGSSRHPVGTAIAFRLRLDAPACVTLWEERAAASEPLLESPRCLPAGVHLLESGGRPLGLVLDTPGSLTFRAHAEAPGNDGPTGSSTVRFTVGEGEDEP